MTPDERTDLEERLIQKEKELEYVMSDDVEFLEKTSNPDN
jgi:hypothetical protein